MTVEHATADGASQFLAAGRYIDSDSREVHRFTGSALEDLDDQSDEARAVRLFEAVRDGIRYDPYSTDLEPDAYRASFVAGRKAAYCVPKAILLTACLRSVGIPAAVGFADVRNHLTSPKLAELLQTDMFIYHGYVQLWLQGKSYKVTPAFNIELCEKFGVKPLVFDGTSDALFHEFDSRDRRHMEYVRDRGIYEEPPIDEILTEMKAMYPRLAELSREQAASPGKAVVYDQQFAARGGAVASSEANSAIRHLEDFEVGEAMTFKVGPLTREEIMAFAQEWDPQPLHLDEDYAKEVHGSLIASGFHTMMHVMRPVVTEMMARSANIGGFGFDNLRWPRPLPPDEVLQVRVEVTGVRPSKSKSDRGILSYKIEAKNSEDQTVFVTETASMIKRREAGT